MTKPEELSKYKHVQDLRLKEGVFYLMREEDYVPEEKGVTKPEEFIEKWRQPGTPYEAMKADLDALLSEAVRGAKGVCEWRFDVEMDHEMWNTSCGEAFCFTEGDPKENDYKFCPGCGKELKEIRTPEEK
jgi:hypothetical protein